jgi:hypothetical protein
MSLKKFLYDAFPDKSASPIKSANYNDVIDVLEKKDCIHIRFRSLPQDKITAKTMSANHGLLAKALGVLRCYNIWRQRPSRSADTGKDRHMFQVSGSAMVYRLIR